jgi:hypothetical protein
MAYIPRNPNGQAVMANSSPVVIASNQSAVPVIVDSGLPAGSNNIGDVDIVTLPNQYTQDAVSPANPIGNALIAVQDSTEATVGPVDGDWIALKADTRGRLYVKDSELYGQVASIVAATALEDSASADAQRGMRMLAVRMDTPATTSDTDGDFETLKMSAGRLFVSSVVTSLPALPAGTNNIGDVDVLTLPNQYTEDTASISNPIGPMLIAVSQALPSLSRVDTIGDNIALTCSLAGRLWVSASIDTEIPPGTNNIGDVDVLSLIPGTGATALGKARDSAIGATDTGIAMLGVRRDTPTAETPIAGDYVVPQYSANGEAWVRLQGEIADDAAFSVGTTRVVPVGLLADETSTDSIDEGDVGAPRMTLDRKQITTINPHTQGGLTIFHLVSAATTNLTNIKASRGQVFGWYIYNSNAAARKVAFHNTAGSPTAGASVVFSIVIPPTSGANVEFTNGIEFATGIAISTVTGLADNDTTAVALNDLIINIFYK